MFHVGEVLQLGNISLRRSADYRPVPWLIAQKDRANSTYRISTKDALEPGEEYVLGLTFYTPICGNSSYTFCYRERPPPNPQVYGRQRETRQRGPLWMTTKLEPAGAKTLFPCWDEPAFKAIFNISLTHSRDIVALTNAPPARTRRLGRGLVRTEHGMTPPMSTYLLALAVGRLTRVSRKTRRGVQLQIWTQPQDLARTEHALAYGTHMLERLENYFLSRYPMRKLDFVAARQYPVGAMENWGLVIFHRDLLLSHESELERLYEEEGSGEDGHRSWSAVQRDARADQVAAHAHRYRSAKIITHELLHQWFGNLVTMSWWSDLWLSEGLTTFFVYRFVREEFPLLADYEYTLMLEKVWRTQSESDKRALVTSFASDEEIMRHFSVLHLYSKGAIISQMLYDLLGERTLRSGLVEYVRSNAYGSVEREDLWRFLGNVSHFARRPVDIGHIMEHWVANPGFPALVVTRSTARTSVTITQRRKKSELLWPIPFQYSALSSWEELDLNSQTGTMDHPFWLYNRSADLNNLEELRPEHTLLVNWGMQFPFRVNYDTRNWVELVSILHADLEKIPEKSRVQLLLDSHLFLQDTDQGAIIFYDLLNYLKNEESLVVLLTGVDLVYEALNAYKASSVFPLLIVLFRDVISSMERRKSRSQGHIEEEAAWSYDVRRLASFNLLLCSASLGDCALSRTAALRQLTSDVPPHGQSVAALCHFLHGSEDDEAEATLLHALQRYRARSSRNSHVLIAASCTRNKKIQKEAVRVLVEQDNAALMSMVLGSKVLVHNRHFRSALWKAVASLRSSRRLRLFRRRGLALICLNSVASLPELRLAARVLPGLRSKIIRLRAKLIWRERKAEPKLQQWLFQKLRF